MISNAETVDFKSETKIRDLRRVNCEQVDALATKSEPT